jgi:hypothetical protein
LKELSAPWVVKTFMLSLKDNYYPPEDCEKVFGGGRYSS